MSRCISSISTVELLVQLREAAEAEAIKIFGRNLHELLLAAPAGPKAVLGLDPGIRTGLQSGGGRCDRQIVGDRRRSIRIQPRNDWQGSLADTGAAGRATWRGTDFDRQWDRQPGDGQAGRRGDQAGRGAEAGATSGQNRGE